MQKRIDQGFDVDGETYLSSFFEKDRVLMVHGPVPSDWKDAGAMGHVHTEHGKPHLEAIEAAKQAIRRKNKP